MAEQSVRREELKQQAFRAILEAIKVLPSYKHAAFIGSVISHLIENEDVEVLTHLVDAIDKTRLRFTEKHS